jgi:hypothetical protein
MRSQAPQHDLESHHYYRHRTMTTAPTSLWALTEEARRLAAEIEELARGLYGDDPEEAALAVSGLEDALLREAQNRDAFRKKADGYCYVISQLRGQAHWRQEEARRLQGLAEEDMEQAERLEDLLIRVMTSLAPDDTSFELPSHRITSRRSEAVEIDVDADVPAPYLTVKTTSTPNKTSLKQAIRAGASFPGVRVVERRSWKIG